MTPETHATSPGTRFQLPPAAVAVAPFLDPRTWGAVAYVWLGFPLGLAWFIGMTVGFLTGIALTILWIGLAILAATLLAVWGAAGLERQLAMLLLGARVPQRLLRPATDERPTAWLRAVLGGSALWKGIFFLAIRFPLGLLGWVGSVVSLSVSIAFMAAPWIVAFGDGYVDLGRYEIDTLGGSWILAAIGFAGFVVTLHLHRALGWIWARLAERLLGADAAAPAAVPAPLPA
jgi:hypothetical protein